MLLRYLSSYSSQILKKASLKTILIVPFVIQVSAAVGLISYLSYTNSRKTVEDLVVQLSDRATKDLEGEVSNYLEKSHLIHQSIAASVDSKILNLNNYSQIRNYFWQEIKRNEYLSFLYFANGKGDFIGVQRKNQDRYYFHIRDNSTVPNRNTYLLDKEGKVTNTLTTSRLYDPRVRGWYQAAQKAKKPTWSPIYSFASSNYTILGISPVTPIYNSSGQFQGVLSNNLSLGQISEFLTNLKISPNAKAIIIERDGNIIATSTNSSPFKISQSKQSRLNISETQDFLIRETAEYLLKKYDRFSEIEDLSSHFEDDHGKRNYLEVKTVKDEFGIDWLILVTIPETDFTSTIDANTRNTIVLSILALAIAIASGILTSQWVAKPILKLNQAAKDIAKGNWDKTFEIDRSDEVGELASSFNKMAAQLKQSFSTLEQRVEERTASLKKAVTEAEMAKEEAIAANLAKDNFLVNISHELRSPLNSILGYTKLILGSDNLNTSQILNLRIVKQSGSHLLALINDLLDFSKSKAGKVQLNLTQFDLLEFIEGVAGIVQMQAREKNLSFKYQLIGGEIPTGIKADELRLRQILLNLLSNAVKFTDRGRVLLRISPIAWKNNRSQIRFEVLDSGVGISSSKLEKIFQPFEQVGDLETRTAGTGLGLSISQEMAQLMGSKIKVKSELGKGSVFSFDITFDVAEIADVKSVESENSKIIGYGNDRTWQILVVDDRKENRLLLLNLLEPLGFKLVEASNGKQGLEIARQIKPDLILTDLLMPEKTGFTMILELRKIPEFSLTPIISLSASNAEIMEKQSLSVGCDGFLPKPIEEEKLFALLQKYLDLNWIFKSESAGNSTSSQFNYG